MAYTSPAVNGSLSIIARKLLGDPPAVAYTTIPTVLDKRKPQLDKLTFAERLQVSSGGGSRRRRW